MQKISEIQITPVKPNNGLIAFCSFVLYEAVYCSSIALFTRPDGTIRLVYPTKKLGSKDLNIFHPINNRNYNPNSHRTNNNSNIHRQNKINPILKQ